MIVRRTPSERRDGPIAVARPAGYATDTYMTSFDFDACVVGAGAVGLACGFALARRGLDVVVLEKESAIGRGVSSRNSEVVHAGLHYSTGSLKARLCVDGSRRLYAFLDQHSVAYRKCGKLVVATDADETGRLETIHAQALANGVEGISRLTGAQAMGVAPGLKAAASLWSPESGVFDSHGYMSALRGRIEELAGSVVPITPFERAILRDGGGFDVRAGGETPAAFKTRLLVIAAGLGAQACANRIQGFPPALIPRLHFGKGVYFRLKGPAPFEPLVYPLPIQGALGTHYRKDLGGQAMFGPDLLFVDREEYGVDPARATTFEAQIRKFWPHLPDDALTPGYAGVRPKLHGPGELQPDFRIDGPGAHGVPGLAALFGIESPGLTSSLAIGEEVANALGV
jgi:L-2-hydroxyglutarate oxidase LhgO